MKKTKIETTEAEIIFVWPYNAEDVEIHPLCAALPAPRPDNYARMKADIAARQVLTYWFAKRKQPTSEQILMVLEFLSSQENENRKRSRAVITRFDGDRIERYITLSDAIP
jgi:hypothetical protein